MNILHLWRAASAGHWVSWASTEGVLKIRVSFNEISKSITTPKVVYTATSNSALLGLYSLKVLLWFCLLETEDPKYGFQGVGDN